MNTPQNFTGNFQSEQGVLLVISISNAQLLCVLAKNLSHLSSRIQTSNKAWEWAWLKTVSSHEKVPYVHPEDARLCTHDLQLVSQLWGPSSVIVRPPPFP